MFRSSLTKLSAVSPLSARGQLRLFSVPSAFLPRAEVEDRVINCVKTFPKVDEAKVTLKSTFTNDLGLDSLDNVELIMALEEEFAIEIPDEVAENLTNPHDVIEHVATHPHAG